MWTNILSSFWLIFGPKFVLLCFFAFVKGFWWCWGWASSGGDFDGGGDGGRVVVLVGRVWWCYHDHHHHQSGEITVIWGIFWHQAEKFDTSTASGASDKYQVCIGDVLNRAGLKVEEIENTKAWGENSIFVSFPQEWKKYEKSLHKCLELLTSD